MTTASKLVAAFGMAAVAYWVTGVAIPYLPETFYPRGVFGPNIFMGWVLGWTIMGRDIKPGWAGRINVTATTASLLYVTCVYIHAFRLMIKYARRVRYSDGTEAVADTFSLAFEIGFAVATPEVLLSLFGGTLFVAVFVQIAARRWR